MVVEHPRRPHLGTPRHRKPQTRSNRKTCMGRVRAPYNLHVEGCAQNEWCGGKSPKRPIINGSHGQSPCCTYSALDTIVAEAVRMWLPARPDRPVAR